MTSRWKTHGVIQIQLGQRRPAPQPDALGRAEIGGDSSLSPREAWEAGRGVWVFQEKRALDQDYVRIVDLEGTVLAVGTIRALARPSELGRYAIEGDLLADHELIGKPTPTPHPSRNSVAYF